MKNKTQKEQLLAQGIREHLPSSSRFELTDGQMQNLTKASEIVLACLAVAGVGALSVIAPNALQALDKFFFARKSGRYTGKQKQRKLAKVFYYLKESGLINVRKDESGWNFSLTPKGKKRVDKFNFNTIQVTKPSVWDGCYWLVGADIPTKAYKNAADMLRWKLKRMNFYPLQRTLWLYPYDPCEELDFIVRVFNVSHFVTVMKVSALDREDEKTAVLFFKQRGVL